MPTLEPSHDLTRAEELKAKRATTKTPENFLGVNANLVNLDELLGPKQAAGQNRCTLDVYFTVPSQFTSLASSANPFLSATGGGASTQVNPFTAAQRPSPTLNQMRQQNNLALGKRDDSCLMMLIAQVPKHRICRAIHGARICRNRCSHREQQCLHPQIHSSKRAHINSVAPAYVHLHATNIHAPLERSTLEFLATFVFREQIIAAFLPSCADLSPPTPPTDRLYFCPSFNPIAPTSNTVPFNAQQPGALLYLSVYADRAVPIDLS